jgi:hypothetical protein
MIAGALDINECLENTTHRANQTPPLTVLYDLH